MQIVCTQHYNGATCASNSIVFDYFHSDSCSSPAKYHSSQFASIDCEDSAADSRDPDPDSPRLCELLVPSAPGLGGVLLLDDMYVLLPSAPVGCAMAV